MSQALSRLVEVLDHEARYYEEFALLLEKEREAVRARVQRLLEQVDSLTNLPSEA